MHGIDYLLFGGGEPWASSPAFRFVPNPKATFDRSVGTGVPPWDAVASVAEDILANPTFGAGEPVSGVDIAGENPDARLAPLGSACD